MNISGLHIEVTDAMKNYVTQKFEKLERHSDNITNVQVTFSVEKTQKKAEIALNMKGTQLHADAQNDDMYAAIDAVTDKIDRQILKHKEKSVDRKHGATH